MKQKTSRLFSILLCIAMLLSLMPMAAFADDTSAEKVTGESIFISLEEAKEIALKHAGLDASA